MRDLICIAFIFIGGILSAQDYEKGQFLFKLKSEKAKPSISKAIGVYSNNENLNAIFKKYQVISYEQAYPFAKNPELLKIFLLKFNGKDVDLKKDLENFASELICDIENIPIPIPTYDPSDYMWGLPTLEDPNGWLWHLKRIQAGQAWDITKSNSNIKIAIMDSDFDILHPDLRNKIIPNYDPLTNVIHSARGASHGTAVASFAAAETDGGGHLSSIGFNSSILAYKYSDPVGQALHASNVMHADVISVSWYYTSGTANPRETQAIQEILNNGTIVVASAGNGGGVPIGPFSPLVDPRIICVTSTGIDDKHQNSGGTHSGYPSVSICAPGYNLQGAVPSINFDGTVSIWPYSIGHTGTSYATPIVAGVCALMKSIDPCLTSESAKSIIQATADPVLDASLYPGMLGSGRINAYKAVMSAGTKTASGIISGIGNYTAGYAVNLNDLTVQSNANITITARKEININGPFEVTLGSSMYLFIDTNAINSCNW